MTDGGQPQPDASAAPAVFTRLIVTPPGLPWDQTRIAQLDASRSAPVAVATLTVRLKRLNRWRHGESGRYAALYVKTEELGSGFSTTLTVDGRTFLADFKSRAQIAAESRQVAVLGGTAAAALLLSIILAFTVVAVRSRAEDTLDALDRQTSRQLRQAEAFSHLKRQRAALAEVADQDAPLSEVIADLAWASKARVADTPVEAFHWRPDAFGVEVRGDSAPFAGSQAQKISRPLRPGVWIWAKPRSSQGGGRP